LSLEGCQVGYRRSVEGSSHPQPRPQEHHIALCLNQTTRDWHTRPVILREAKGLAARFFAALKMTLPKGSRCKVYQCHGFRFSGLLDCGTRALGNALGSGLTLLLLIGIGGVTYGSLTWAINRESFLDLLAAITLRRTLGDAV
jgi:hypothetical protein